MWGCKQTTSLNAPTPPSPDSQSFNIGCNNLTNSFQVSLFIIHSAFSRSFVCFCSFEFKYRINRNTVSLRCYHYVYIIYNGYEFFYQSMQSSSSAGIGRTKFSNIHCSCSFRNIFNKTSRSPDFTKYGTSDYVTKDRSHDRPNFQGANYSPSKDAACTYMYLLKPLRNVANVQ